MNEDEQISGSEKEEAIKAQVRSHDNGVDDDDLMMNDE